jgi:hypothetical protein
MARAHTAGSRRGKAREHGDELASFAYLFFFLFKNSCGGKKGIHICRNFAKTKTTEKAGLIMQKTYRAPQIHCSSGMYGEPNIKQNKQKTKQESRNEKQKKKKHKNPNSNSNSNSDYRLSNKRQKKQQEHSTGPYTCTNKGRCPVGDGDPNYSFFCSSLWRMY